MIEVITLEVLQKRCNLAQTDHYGYVVESYPPYSIAVRISYREHNFFGELRNGYTVIRFVFPSYVKNDKIWVVMDVLRVEPHNKFWSPDLLAPLLNGHKKDS